VTCDLCEVCFHDKSCNISPSQYLCLTHESKGIDHLEGELLEVRKGLKIMNKAVEGMKKIVEEIEEIRKNYGQGIR